MSYPMCWSRFPLRGSLGHPLGLSPEEEARQAAAVATARAATNEMIASVQAEVDTYGGAVDGLARGVYAASTGNVETAVREWNRAVTSALAIAGPVGSAIAAIYNVLVEGAMWLVKAWPATVVECARYFDTEILKALGYTGDEDGAGLGYRRDGWLYVATCLSRSTRLDPFRFYSQETGLRYDLCAGADAARETTFKNDYLTPSIQMPGPPIGWGSWESYFRDHPEAEEPIAVAGEAAGRIGSTTLTQMRSVGALRHFSMAVGDLRWVCGQAFKVRALPDYTLERLIIDMVRFQSADSASLPPRAQAIQGIVIPGLPTPIGITWRDNLADAIKEMIYASQFKTQHFYTLLSEYNRRGLGGVRGSRTSKAGGAGTSEGIGAIPIVAGAAGVGLLAWLLLAK